MTQPQKPALTHSDRIRQLAVTRQGILSGPTERAMATILDHQQPAALVHSFAEEDLHFLIHDIGPDDSLPLLALSSNRQWEYLLDVEAWRRDRINYQQATTWLQLLLQADPDRLVRWCFDEKLEFLEMYLFRNLELRIRESDQAPSDFGDGFFSDDDTFYVRFVDYPVNTPEEEAVRSQRNDMLGQLLRRLSRFDHPRYQGMLMEAVSVIPGETEEALFRLRNVRLGEKGFLPFYEAVGIYQPLRPGGFNARGKKAIYPPSPEGSRFPVPQFTAAFLGEGNLFVRALKGVSEAHVIQQLQVELASLCNRVISADQVIIRGREHLKPVVAKVSGYLAIGLERLTEKTAGIQEKVATALLQHHLLEDIFRTGFSGALQLKWRATRWRKESWCQAQQVGLTFWDKAWLGMLGGLLIDMPKFYDPSTIGSYYRDFKTQEEIITTGRRLSQVMALDQLLEKMALPIGPVSGTRLLTYKNLLLTLWARASLEVPPKEATMEYVALSLSIFRGFYKSLWRSHKGHRIIGDGKKAEFLQWAARASDQQPADLSESLGTVFESLFDEIQHELAPVQAGNLDPRYVDLFLLKP